MKTCSGVKPASQPAVMVLQVVPIDVGAVPLPGVRDALESSRVLRLVPAGLELAFNKGVVVADPWSAMAARNAQFLHQIQVAARNHRRAPILMERQRPLWDVVVGHRFLEKLLGQCGILLVRDHPGYDEAAVEVQHHVEVEVDAAAPDLKPHASMARLGGSFKPTAFLGAAVPRTRHACRYRLHPGCVACTRSRAGAVCASPATYGLGVTW